MNGSDRRRPELEGSSAGGGPKRSWLRRLGVGAKTPPPDAGDERADAREEALAGTVAEFVERSNAGTPANLWSFLDEHPDVADDILHELGTYQWMDWAVDDPETPASTPTPARFGDFELLRVIGEGTFGVVHEAREGSLDRRVALKILKHTYVHSRKAVNRFLQREAKVIARFEHPNLVHVHSAGKEDGVPYINMEFVDGENLQRLLLRARWLNESRSRNGSAADHGAGNEADALLIDGFNGASGDYFRRLADAFAGVAEGLQHAHGLEVIHRDIKPSNIIVGEDSRLRLVDFGLAHAEDGQGLSTSQDRVGTLLYMSPEQVENPSGELTPSTDIYSLGATMYEALALAPPFQGRSAREIENRVRYDEPAPLRKLNPRVPWQLEAIVGKCLLKRPESRFGTAEALAQELRRFARGDRIETEPRTPLELLAGRLWRHRLVAARVAAAAALLLTVGLLLKGWSENLAREAKRDAAARLQDAVGEMALGLLPTEALRAMFGDRIANVPLAPESPEDELKDRSGGAIPAMLEPHAVLDELGLEREVLRRETFRRAREHLEEARRRWRGGLAVYALEAEILLREGKQARAEARLRRALRRQGDYVPALVLLTYLQGGSASLDPRIAGVDWAQAWLAAKRFESERRWSEAAASYTLASARMPAGDEEQSSIDLALRLSKGIASLYAGNLKRARETLGSVEDRWKGRSEPTLILGLIDHLENDRQGAAVRFREAFDAAASKGSSAVEVACAIASIYRGLGDPSSARFWAEQARALDARDLQALHLLGTLAMEDREFNVAEQRFREAAAAHPGAAAPLLASGVLEEFRGRPGRAEARFQEALAKHPESSEAHYHQGRLEARLGDLDKASAHYQEAVKLGGPSAAFASNNLGTILDRQGDLGAAIEAYREAAALDPDLAVARFNLGWAHQRQSLWGEAAAAYQHAIALRLDTAEVHANLGPCLQNLGDYEGAERAYLSALERSPDNYRSLKSLASLYDWIFAVDPDVRWYREERTIYERIVARWPEWFEARYWLAEMCDKLEDNEEAFTHYHKALELKDDFFWSYWGLAGMLLKLDAEMPSGEALKERIRSFEKGVRSLLPATHAEELLERYRDKLLPDFASRASIDWWIDRPEALIPAGAEWRFFRGTREPAEELAWKHADFDDGGWESAPAPLGHPAESGAATALADMPGGYTTLYLRRRFRVEDPGALEKLLLLIRLRSDEGFVAYLNGVEIGREQMETTVEGREGIRRAPRFDAVAVDAIDPRAWKTWRTRPVRVSPSRLAAGENVLAVYALEGSPEKGSLAAFHFDAVLLASPPPEDARRLRAEQGLADFAAAAGPGGDRRLLAYFEGRRLALLGEHGAAAARFQESLDLDPETVEPWFRLAESLRASGEHAGAEETLAGAIRSRFASRPELWDAWLRLAMVDLRRSPGEILERFPIPRWQLEDRSPHGADIAWLLDRLAAHRPLLINSGGGGSDSEEAHWGRDRFFASGSNSLYLKDLNTGLAGAPRLGLAPAIALNERQFESLDPVIPAYRVPLPPGTYRVTLTFVEAWKDAKDRRSFDILLEGVTRRSDYQPIANGVGVFEEIPFEVPVDDGILDLDFISRSIEKPQLCALSIEALP